MADTDRELRAMIYVLDLDQECSGEWQIIYTVEEQLHAVRKVFELMTQRRFDAILERETVQAFEKLKSDWKRICQGLAYYRNEEEEVKKEFEEGAQSIKEGRSERTDQLTLDVEE